MEKMFFSQMTEFEMLDLEQACFDLAETFIEENGIFMSKPGFFDAFVSLMTDYVFAEGIYEQWCTINDRAHLETWMEEFCRIFMKVYSIPAREVMEDDLEKDTIEDEPDKLNDIDKTLAHLQTLPVQVQRSPEWYEIRQTLFSASNLWKLFSTPAQFNSLIYEKCVVKPQESKEFINTNPNPRNWGIKYEPVTRMIYEHKYNTTVNSNYGCIPHKLYPIGASPDGINVDRSNLAKYGKMVEIKNIYNRVIDGIPSEEYWIQIQIQLETCNLFSCDFVETRIKEYTEEEYSLDLLREYKGVVLFFIPRDLTSTTHSSQYIYIPLYITEETVPAWIEDTKLSYPHLVLYETFYWYLDELSCTEVYRNPVWFEQAIPKIEQSWQIVLKERQNGFEHRAPKKRSSEDDLWLLKHSSKIPNAVCLIKLDHD